MGLKVLALSKRIYCDGNLKTSCSLRQCTYLYSFKHLFILINTFNYTVYTGCFRPCAVRIVKNVKLYVQFISNDISYFLSTANLGKQFPNIKMPYNSNFRGVSAHIGKSFPMKVGGVTHNFITFLFLKNLSKLLCFYFYVKP